MKENDVKFVTGHESASHIRKILKDPAGTDIAVAFWGRGAVQEVELHDASGPVRVVCNLLSGGTNPEVIRELLRYENIWVKHCKNLHAKMYANSTEVLISSANASSNGLGYEGAEISGWREAGIVTTSADVVDESCSWFANLWKESEDIEDADLQEAERQWERQRRYGPARREASLIWMLRNNPEALEGEVLFAPYMNYSPSPEVDEMAPHYCEQYAESSDDSLEYWEAGQEFASAGGDVLIVDLPFRVLRNEKVGMLEGKPRLYVNCSPALSCGGGTEAVLCREVKDPRYRVPNQEWRVFNEYKEALLEGAESEGRFDGLLTPNQVHKIMFSGA